jgi:hypothetical protein
MNFLAPLFLLGGLAVAGPVILHLTRRRTREVTPFSTLLFLRSAPPRVQQQRRFEDVGLLLLRAGVIALIAVGFARPFLGGKRQVGGLGEVGVRTVLLVDTSASMRRESLWADACVKAGEIIKEASPGDELAVFTFDVDVRERLSFEQWRRLPLGERAAVANSVVGSLSPGWGSTGMDSALTEVADLLGKEGGAGALRVVVVSDFQEGARVDGVQGFKWPEGLCVQLESVRARSESNASLEWLSEDPEDSGARVRVTNSLGATVEQFTLRWEGPQAGATGGGRGAKEPEVVAYVPAGQSRVVRLPKPLEDATTLRLLGDSEPFDNLVYRVAVPSVKLPVLCLGLDAGEDPRGLLYYLRRALPRTPLHEIEIQVREGVPTPEELDAAQLLILGEAAEAAAADAAAQFARGGHVVLVPVASSKAGALLARLLGKEEVRVAEVPGGEYALLGEIDFQHPLFAPFADPRYSDFTKVHFWRRRRLECEGWAGARVAARFDDGLPAVVEVPAGAGSVVVLASLWSPQDGQFALSSKFVPWMNALLEMSSRAVSKRGRMFVGEEFALPDSVRPLSVRCPDGSVVQGVGGQRFGGTQRPGIYEVQPVGVRFAVNVPAAESRTAPLTAGRLAALGLPIAEGGADVSGTEGRRQREAVEALEVEGQQKGWRWLILGALIFVGAETVVSWRRSNALAKEVGV